MTIVSGRPKYLEKTCPFGTLSTTSPTSTTLSLNSALSYIIPILKHVIFIHYVPPPPPLQRKKNILK